MAKTVLGLDIGTKYIKYVVLEHLGRDRYRLLSIGMSPSPARGIASEVQVDQEALAQNITKLLKDGGVRLKSVNIALPEAQVFTRIIQVPKLSERELASAIRWEAEQYIPLPLSEVQMDFSIVGETIDEEQNQLIDVLIIAAPKKIIGRYSGILDMCDLIPEVMETEIISASRSLLPAVTEKPISVMVINLGAQSTDFSILKGGVIAFTRTLPTGGNNFTRALSQNLGIPLPQAEEYKKTYGLEEDKLEAKVYKSIQPIFSVMVEEMKRAITYFQNKYPDESVSTIILSGGSAKLPGLVAHITDAVSIETQVGNPWTRIEKDQARFGKIEEEGPVFAVATGLAMRLP